MTALQFAIGALNDVVDAPADAGRVPPKPIPGGLVVREDGPDRRGHRRGRRPGARRAERPRAACCWAASSWRSAPPTTSSPRARPGRGCRSRSASRSSRSSAGTAPRERCPASSSCWSRWRSSPERGSPSPTLASMSRTTRVPAWRRWRPRWDQIERGGSTRRSMAAATGLGIVFVGRASWAPLTVAAIAIGTALVSLGLSAARGRSRGAPGVEAGRRRRSVPRSRRSAGSRGCCPAPSRNGQSRDLAGADDRDRVLQPELRDRQVFREVGAVDVGDLVDDLRRAQHARRDHRARPRATPWRSPASPR